MEKESETSEEEKSTQETSLCHMQAPMEVTPPGCSLCHIHQVAQSTPEEKRDLEEKKISQPRYLAGQLVQLELLAKNI